MNVARYCWTDSGSQDVRMVRTSSYEKVVGREREKKNHQTLTPHNVSLTGRVTNLTVCTCSAYLQALCDTFFLLARCHAPKPCPHPKINSHPPTPTYPADVECHLASYSSAVPDRKETHAGNNRPACDFSRSCDYPSVDWRALHHPQGLPTQHCSSPSLVLCSSPDIACKLEQNIYIRVVRPLSCQEKTVQRMEIACCRLWDGKIGIVQSCVVLSG